MILKLRHARNTRPGRLQHRRPAAARRSPISTAFIATPPARRRRPSGVREERLQGVPDSPGNHAGESDGVHVAPAHSAWISGYELPPSTQDAEDVSPQKTQSSRSDGAVLLGVHGVLLATGSEHDIRPNGLRCLLADRCDSEPPRDLEPRMVPVHRCSTSDVHVAGREVADRS